MPPEIASVPELAKYWAQRYRLFSRFDDGIKLDRGNLIGGWAIDWLVWGWGGHTHAWELQQALYSEITPGVLWGLSVMSAWNLVRLLACEASAQPAVLSLWSLVVILNDLKLTKLQEL